MSAFTLEIAADPTWAPMTRADVLEQDGCYCGTIIAEKPTADDANKPGIWLTIELDDADVQGKRLQKMLGSADNVRFLWRGLLASIAGDVQAGQSAFSYSLGRFAGAKCYFKVGSYLTSKGDVASGVNEWLLANEYNEAVKKGRSRWARAVSAKSSDVSAFGLPTGTPVGFGVQAPLTTDVPAGVAPVSAPSVPQPKKNAFPAFPGLK